MVAPDDLYGLPLDRFVPERGALAKALRAEGRREEAARVGKLRKPSAAAWAVNQLVRTQGRAVADLLAAGDAVREAQSAVLAGRGDARALRDAGVRERESVAALVEVARGLLSADGHELSATTLERVSDTLHAAALDDASREQLRDGRLERELRHIGLGLGAGVAEAPRAPSPSRAPPRKRAGAKGESDRTTAAERAAEKRAATERAAAQAAEEAERQAARKAARAAASKAAKRAELAEAALRAAEERRERAANALAEADEALEAARAAAAEAAREHREARAALDALD